MEPIIMISSIAILIIFAFLILYSATRKAPILEEPEKAPTSPSVDWLKTAYDSTIDHWIETDREIWQIATIFLSASLLILGWVVVNFGTVELEVLTIAGTASVALVGVSTLDKHRMGRFNLLHARYLRRLERAFMQDDTAAAYWGLHHVRLRLKTRRNILSWATSLHGLSDIYFFLFAFLWIGLWFVASNRGLVEA